MRSLDAWFRQIEKAKERYSADKSAEAMSEEGYRSAASDKVDDDAAKRARLKRLNAPVELIETIGTRATIGSLATEGMSPRASFDVNVLERILGTNDLMPISYLWLGLQRSRSVGRIEIRNRDRQRLGFGTGFLVSPHLVMTNNHVLESPEDARYSVLELDYEVDLNKAFLPKIEFALDPDKFFLTDERLDFTLVAVAPNGEKQREPREWGWHRLLEQEGLITADEYVSIIQHPQGEPKQIAMRENKVVELRDDFTWYHTDTAPGSSGSPVFNDQWELVALHHSGVPATNDQDEILTTDNQVWEPWMGEHRVKWEANEGAAINRISEVIKNAQGLNGEQKRLRDELFDGASVAPLIPAAIYGASQIHQSITPPVDPGGQFGRSEPERDEIPTTSPLSGNSATIELPLRITFSIGDSSTAVKASTPVSTANLGGSGVPAPSATSADDSQLQQALAEARAAREQEYFDEESNTHDVEQYYKDIKIDELSASELFNKLNALLKATHTRQPAYAPSRQVYPWVDLHPDRQLRSIYSGKTFSAEELIREDFRISQERDIQLREKMQRESILGAEQVREAIDMLETQNPFNCEHVVPQSWFGKLEPMRGDLHHLFTCESGCNSFRSNIAYFDFSDFEEAVRTDCGKREGNRFEPSRGKGAVARATLYFLLRYPGKIDSPAEFPQERLSTLLQWHHDHPVGQYERHRNQAIFHAQGNRNPLIDFPAWAGKLEFEHGLL